MIWITLRERVDGGQKAQDKKARDIIVQLSSISAILPGDYYSTVISGGAYLHVAHNGEELRDYILKASSISNNSFEFYDANDMPPVIGLDGRPREN